MPAKEKMSGKELINFLYGKESENDNNQDSK